MKCPINRCDQHGPGGCHDPGVKVKRPPVDPIPLGELAKSAHKAVADQAQAFEAERKAEVALLEKVIELARPGLPAICSKVQGWPMECVQVGRSPLLMLTMDGAFLSPGFRESDAPLSTADVVDTWEPADIVSELSKLFMKQIMGRGTSTAGSQERTAKLLALAALIGDI